MPGEAPSEIPYARISGSLSGRHEFPKNLSAFELRQWFTFDERDRRCIRKAFRSRYWIGPALHWGFLAMTGITLGSLEYEPAVLLRHPRAAVRAEGSRPRHVAIAVPARPDCVRTPAMGR